MTIAYNNMSNKKLYDCRVEYLESTGTQCIDTGVIVQDGLTLDMDVQRVEYTPMWACWYGSYDGYFFYMGRDYHNNTKAFNFTNGNSSGSVDFDLSEDDFYHYHIESGNSWTDNRSGSHFKSTLTWTYVQRPFKSSIGLFARKDPDGRFVCNSKIRVKRFTFTINNKDKILDLVPVRFTNENEMTEGAMFDEVSKKLFRNLGKGSFICGLDLKG